MPYDPTILANAFKSSFTTGADPSVKPLLDNYYEKLAICITDQSNSVVKDEVRVGTTGNITLSGLQTIDDISLNVDDSVLVKDQTDQTKNGIYLVKSTSWIRRADADVSADFTPGFQVFILEGTVNADSGWIFSTDGTISLGITNLNFIQFTGAGQIIAGPGLTKSGNQLIVGTASSSRIVVNADTIDLASGIVTPGTYAKLTVDTYGRVTAGGTLASSDLPNATTTTTGAVKTTTANYTVVSTDDSRMSDSRTPNGAAGGDLSGTYPNPTLVNVITATTKGDSDKCLTITVDSKGRVTTIVENLIQISETQVTNLTTDLNAKLNLSGGIMTGDLTLNGLPTNALHAASKSYVDNLITGITWKKEVKAATIGNITLSGLQTVDGISLVAGDRCLVKNQTSQIQNGIYVVASGTWTRADDADSTIEIETATVLVRLGTVNSDTQWTCTNSNEPVIGTDAITFGQIAGAGTYTNGAGLSLAGNVFSISTSYTGQSSISTVGIITTGTWNGTALADTYISSASAWNSKEPGITSGSTAQYWRGDKTWQSFDTAARAAMTGAVSTVLTADLSSNLVLLSNSSGKIAVSTIQYSSSNYGINTSPNLSGWNSTRQVVSVLGSDASILELGTSLADASGNIIGATSFYSSTSGGELARIQSNTNGTTSGNRGGNLAFYTKADAGSLLERVRFVKEGHVGVNTTAPNILGYGSTNRVLTIIGASTYGAIEVATGASVADGNIIGDIAFVNNSATSKDAAIIRVTQDGSTTGGKISFFTRTNGGSLGSAKLTLDNTGLFTTQAISITDGKDITIGTITGTKFGSVTSKIGIWGATPIVQPASANQAAVAAATQRTITDSSAGTAGTTLAALGGVTYATDVATLRNWAATLAATLAEVKSDIAAIKTFQNQNRTDQISVGIIKGSA